MKNDSLFSRKKTVGEWPVWQTDLCNPGFASYAESCGGKGIRVTRANELESALKSALEHPGPALVEIITDADLI
jgi:thiamine pyrophosphate-dependent acetolactate synthase large subunit-like protein